MTIDAITAVIPVMPVKDFEMALAWYTKLLGRAPDLMPMEGVAEWQLADSAFVQLSQDEQRAGATSLVIAVENVDTQRDTLVAEGFSVSDIEEYPDVVKLMVLPDPEGNEITFVQDISGSV